MSATIVDGNIHVTIDPPITTSVWLSRTEVISTAETDPLPTWDPTWPTSRIATLPNLGATLGYTRTITDTDTLNDPTYPFDTFIKDGNGGFTAYNDGSTIGFCGTKNDIAVTAGNLYDISFRAENMLGGGAGLTIVAGLGAAVLDGVNSDEESFANVVGNHRKVYTAITTRNVGIMMPASTGGNAKGYKISNMVIQEIIPTVKNDYIYRTVCCWGDSHTAGIYPYRLRHLVTNGYVYNGGVGGEGSREILARFLAAPEKFNQPQIIWSGTNNTYEPEQVLADIATMVAALGHTRYIIMGVMGTAFSPTGSFARTNITTINTALAATYGSKFIDIEAYIISQYNPLLPQDVIDYNSYILPYSLRADNAHLTFDGYDMVVAKLLSTWPTFFQFLTVPAP